jgi:hypothetical protein
MSPNRTSPALYNILSNWKLIDKLNVRDMAVLSFVFEADKTSLYLYLPTYLHHMIMRQLEEVASTVHVVV